MGVSLAHADMLEWLAAYDGAPFDSCVTDPPYHLTSIVKRFGGKGAAPAQDRDGLYQRASRGFMGKTWDGGDIAQRVETWRAVFDVLKPGAHLVAFAGTRTFHRMAVAIEDAGFEIRDMLCWHYGSGWPKVRSALKPALEPICLARKPLSEKSIAANVLMHGVGALNIDECRIGDSGARNNGRSVDSAIFGKLGPMERRDYACGRWPANVITDGSDDVVAMFPEAPGQMAPVRPDSGGGRKTANVYGDFAQNNHADPRGDAGSAARFFYSAKAGPLDRIGSSHATIKPVDLMRWLARLVTPPGGRVLEPFAGSGTTGIACIAEGFGCQMIELEADHVADIERKLAFLRGDGGHSAIELHKAKRDRAAAEGLPPLGGLFGDAA